jgi:hypothetical protein
MRYVVYVERMSENMKIREHLIALGVDERMLLKWTLFVGIWCSLVTPMLGSIFWQGGGRNREAAGDIKSHHCTQSRVQDGTPVQACREYQSRQFSILERLWV